MRGAAQFMLVPPLTPPHDQFQLVPTVLTPDGLPEEQSAVGIFSFPTPFAVPHTPSTFLTAEQVAVEPPFDPAQVHEYGPDPDTLDAAPAVQRFDDGAE